MTARCIPNMNSSEMHDKKMKISSKLSSLCRTCLAAENETDTDLYPISDIFVEDDAMTSQVQSFEEVLCLFVDNEINNQKDRLPKIMCLSCIEKARSAFLFIEMCRRTDALLLELFNDEKEEIDTKPIIDDKKLVAQDILRNTEQIETLDTERHTEMASHGDLIIEKSPMEETIVEEHLESEVEETVEKEDPEESKLYFRHVCEICNKTFTQSQTLNRHRKIHFKNSEPGKPCNYCGRKFLRSDDLRRHIRTHTNERPYECNICNKAYKQSYELKEHKALMHPVSGVRKFFSCTICDKQLTTRNGLYVHMKVHRGEKNHECIFCDKKFVTSGELASHLKHIHASTERFPCGVGGCARKFVTKAALRNHQNTKHNVTEKTATS